MKHASEPQASAMPTPTLGREAGTRRRVFFPAIVLGLVVSSAAFVACKTQESTPTPAPSASAIAADPAEAAAPAAPSESASAVASAPPPKPPLPRNAGQAGLLLSAARGLDLRDPEKTKKLDDIAASFTETDGTKDEGKAVQDELAAQVKAGKIDNTKLEPLLVALEKGAKESHDKQVTALDGIYAALGPLERKTMVENLRKKIGGRDAHEKGHDAGAPPDERKRIAESMTKSLGLDEAQAKKVEPLIPTGERKKMEDMRDEERKHLDALFTAFEKDGFQAKTLPFRDPKKLRAPFQDQVRFYTALLPILKPEQREKLAQNMLHRGGGHPGGRPGHPMKPGAHGPHGWGDGEP